MLKQFDEDFERKKQSADPNVPDQQPEPETETVKFTLKIPYLGKNSESG